MKRYIELNNRAFEVKKLKGEVHPLEYRTLDDCYAKPSSLKRAIYDEWDKWLVELANCGQSGYGYGLFTVLSYNVMMFTLGAEVYNKVGEFSWILLLKKNRLIYHLQNLWLYMKMHHLY